MKSPPQVYSVLIVGGGLAGTLLQRALPGHSVLVTAPVPTTFKAPPPANESSRDALLGGFPSSVSPPVGLAHPYPGRSLKIDMFRKQVLSTSLPALAELAAELPDLVKPLPMLRPLYGPAGARLKKSFYSMRCSKRNAAHDGGGGGGGSGGGDGSSKACAVAMVDGETTSVIYPELATSHNSAGGDGVTDGAGDDDGEGVLISSACDFNDVCHIACHIETPPPSYTRTRAHAHAHSPTRCGVLSRW